MNTVPPPSPLPKQHHHVYLENNPDHHHHHKTHHKKTQKNTDNDSIDPDAKRLRGRRGGCSACVTAFCPLSLWDVDSKPLIYRNIELLLHGIERILPSIPRHPRFFYADNERNVSTYRIVG